MPTELPEIFRFLISGNAAPEAPAQDEPEVTPEPPTCVAFVGTPTASIVNIFNHLGLGGALQPVDNPDVIPYTPPEGLFPEDFAPEVEVSTADAVAAIQALGNVDNVDLEIETDALPAHPGPTWEQIDQIREDLEGREVSMPWHEILAEAFPVLVEDLSLDDDADDFDVADVPTNGWSLFTPREIELINTIRTLGEQFIELSAGGDSHDDDLAEVDLLLNTLENIVISQIAARSNPEFFHRFGA